MKKSKSLLAWMVGAFVLYGEATHAQADTIRPFKVHMPAKELNDLRRRIKETRWPDKETVTDQSQGAQLKRLQELVQYWGSDYDWRRAEARLNLLPQFT